MASSYKDSLATARRVFTLLIIVLTNDSVRAKSKTQLMSLIKEAKATNATELGEIVRRAVIYMAEETYKNGVNLGHVDGVIQRIRRDGHI